ncbi:MAG: hypothetical protein EPO26_13805 [Chloroflexota bacterium]|nr:MAG: hypothetical protein EPO26_13805 [Chloroflexota bacterium]
MNRIVGLGGLAMSLIALAMGIFVLFGGRVQDGDTTVPAGERTFYMTGLEYKGSTSTKDLPAPPVAPNKIGDGYRYKPPGEADKGDPTKWEVSTYRWEPGLLQVFRGDKVSLVGFIVNGDHHKVWIEDPKGQVVVKEQDWQRGREYKASFVADKVGYYKIHCDEHDPSMTGYVLVTPR